MHDLYCEYLVLEAKGKLVEAISIGDRRWMYVDIRDGISLSLKLHLLVDVGRI